MGKYIIEVGDAYAEYICGKGDMLCLPVRINEFDDNWLNTNIPLMPYTEPDTEKVSEEAYQQGLSDAWEAARKIILPSSRGGFTFNELAGRFGSDVSEYDVVEHYSASEAVEKIRQYEQEQKQEEEQIQVGDEVKDDKDDIGICTEISYPANSIHIMYADGTATDISLTGVTKTGRHFFEIAAVLAKMKEES